MRLWREPTSTVGTYALGVSMVVLALTRPLGPVWVVALLALLAALLRTDGLRRLIGGSIRRAWTVAALVIAAVALNIGWQLAVTPTSRPVSQVLGFIPAAVLSLPETFGEAIGVFGWDDTLMPRPAYAAFGFALVALLSTALFVGRRREVRVLELALVVVTGLIVALTAAVILPTGFTAQGRYMLPALMVLPLLAGEIVHLNRGRLGEAWSGAMVIGLVGVTALVQMVAWYAAAHRFAVGTGGPWLFFASARWEPPWGWWPWTSLAGLGTVALLISAIIGLLSQRASGLMDPAGSSSRS